MILLKNILRNRNGISLVELSINMLIISGLMFFSISPPNMDKFTDDGLKDLAYSVDSALAQWARFNSGTYPTDLTRLIDVGILPEKTPVEKFTYETAAANTTYRLVVTLAKGGEYTSPGSKY